MVQTLNSLYENQVPIETKYFLGNYEKVIDHIANETKEYYYLSSPSGLMAVATKTNGANLTYKYILTDHLGSIQMIVNDAGIVENEYSYDPWGRSRNAYDWRINSTSIPAFSRGFTGHEHLLEFGLINMNGRLYDPLIGRMLSPDNFVQNPENSLGFNRYSYAANNPLIYTDQTGEIFWVPIIIGAVIGTYMGGTLANNDYNPANWDFSSGQTWGYMAVGLIVGGLSGYIGAEIAASEVPLANTLGIAGSSLSNSIGTHFYTGGHTDINLSLGVASFNFTQGEWGYIGKSGNSVLQNIGYGFGAVANAADLYKLFTWDILSPEEKINKLQKIMSDITISYDPNLQRSAIYDPNTDSIVFGRDGLKSGLGWAKSTYQHEAIHRGDYTTQPFVPSHIRSQSEYNAFLDSRAYNFELSKSFQNCLNYKQHMWLQQKYIHYSEVAGITPGTISNYTFIQWLRSLLSR